MCVGMAAAECVVDVVGIPSSDSEDSFPGLYLNALSEQPFVDDSTLLLTTQWRSTSEVVAINLDSKRVQRLRTEGSRGSWSLLSIGCGACLSP